MHFIDLFDRGARINAQGLALAGAGGEFTYAQAQGLTIRIAKAFRARGFGLSTPYAVFSPNNGLAMISLLGGLRAGGAWCNVNLRNGVDANVDVMYRGGCKVLFYDISTSETVAEMLPRLPEIELAVCFGGSDGLGVPLDELIADHDETFVRYDMKNTDVGFQGSTGGTTGAPKITQSNNDFITYNTLGWMTEWSFDVPAVNLAVAPITHAGGVIALAHFPIGGTVVMMDHVDIEELLANIAKYQVTTLFLPPTIIYMLLAHPKARDFDYSSLRYVISAAAPIAPQKIKEGIALFGPVMGQSYGQTEAGFPVTSMSPRETAEAAADPKLEHRLLSCGRQTMTVDSIEAMDDEGNLLGPNATGELVIRAPSVMLGYLNDPEASAESRKHGWHHTGDIGYIDEDGYIYIVDRIRDMVVSGGFNIFPFEVEQVLMKHPAVQDCAVIGVPDEKWGEAVKAVVQLAPGKTAEAAELIAFAKEELGGMKAPKSVDFIEDLPRSAVGKVLKREIRKPYWEGHERAVG